MVFFGISLSTNWGKSSRRGTTTCNRYPWVCHAKEIGRDAWIVKGEFSLVCQTWMWAIRKWTFGFSGFIEDVKKNEGEIEDRMRNKITENKDIQSLVEQLERSILVWKTTTFVWNSKAYSILAGFTEKHEAIKEIVKKVDDRDY